MKRNDFIKNICSLLGIGVIVQSWESCSSNTVVPRPSGNFTIDLTSAANSALKTIGGYLITQGIFIKRTGQSNYFALSMTCTHQGCQVNYNSANNDFVCPCHGGTYNSNGSVVSGPPPAPLPQYQVTVSGTLLTVSG
jgi:cytochrome b6-f complex iron-sulfur subunit